MPNVSIISLGCPRNQLDSEVIAGLLKKSGFTIVGESDHADVCVINTCAFISTAREESVEKILAAARLKKSGKIGRLVICGCLPQLYKEDISAELKEADLIIGTSDFPKLPGLLRNRTEGSTRSVISRNPDYLYDETSPRIRSTSPHYAYLKISEGCSNYCSYCIISRLRGAFRSRPVSSVVEEVKKLSKPGKLREIDIIGQDTTLFGIDRYGKMMLGDLLRRVCALKNDVKWVRVLYTHPAHYTDDFISAVRGEKKICKYLDLPIQHISDKILKAMNRRVTKKELISLIEKLRKRIPGLVLRTSVIVGFPGETDKDFDELLGFLRDIKFDRLGAFTYSKEDLTRSARLPDHLPEKIKKERYNIVMELQQGISREINKKYLGKTVEVLIDEKLTGEKGKFLGRTSGDAPEIDGVVHVSGKGMKVGEMYKVKITDTLEYDLIGMA